MFSKIKEKISESKDILLSKGIQFAINKYLKEAGKCIECKLNTKNQTIEIKLELIGESEVLVLQGDYDLKKENDEKYFICIKDIKTSKEWVNILAKEYLKEQIFEIPEKYAYLVEKLL